MPGSDSPGKSHRQLSPQVFAKVLQSGEDCPFAIFHSKIEFLEPEFEPTCAEAVRDAAEFLFRDPAAALGVDGICLLYTSDAADE